MVFSDDRETPPFNARDDQIRAFGFCPAIRSHRGFAGFPRRRIPMRALWYPSSRKASKAPVRANGRAKTECSNLIISSVKRRRFPIIGEHHSTLRAWLELR